MGEGMVNAPLDSSTCWPLIAATRSNAHYDPERQRIVLRWNSGRLRGALQLDPDYAPHEVLPVLLHEFRHWLDHSTSLWGQRRISLMLGALAARASNNVDEFPRIVAYDRAARRDLRADYYTTTNQAEGEPADDWRWLATPSLGFEFDSTGEQDKTAPIPFMRFEWPDETFACRVPMTTTALLEATAVHTEIETERWCIDHLPEERRATALDEMESKWFRKLYTPELGVYSAAVHWAANRLRLSTASEAYRKAAAVASVVLNLPESRFRDLTVPRKFSPWKDGNEHAKGRLELGYAYLLILSYADETLDALQGADWLDVLLNAAGLPNREDLTNEALAEAQSLSPWGRAAEVSDRWAAIHGCAELNRSRLGLFPTPEHLISNIRDVAWCPVLCQDKSWVPLGPSTAIQCGASQGAWEGWCTPILEECREFLAACR